MIRRGLQILLSAGITALGAAPCFASFPSDIVLQGFNVVTNVGDPNGYYVQTGTTGVDGSTLFSRYATEPDGPKFSILVRWFANSQWQVAVRRGLTDANVSLKTVGGASNSFPGPSSWVGGWTGYSGYDPGTTAALVVPSGDYQYEVAFPDWESAAVKIPLGFTFAMSFWAAAVALSIGMKWVRDLASAAS